MASGRCLIGTSGWSYRHWRGGAFYPKGLRQSDELGFYAERLASVEVNGTFYRLIAKETFRKWCEQTPPNFVFACKGSRYLTHMKRLKEQGEGVRRLFERLDALERRLGPVVFQLPDRFKPDLERLAGFLDALPAAHRYAFEFRDPAWFAPAVLELLARRNVALCLYEFAGRTAPLEVTAGIRLHPPARAGRRIPGLLRRCRARDLGRADPRLDEERPRRLLLFRQRRARFRAARRVAARAAAAVTCDLERLAGRSSAGQLVGHLVEALPMPRSSCASPWRAEHQPSRSTSPGR